MLKIGKICSYNDGWEFGYNPEREKIRMAYIPSEAITRKSDRGFVIGGEIEGKEVEILTREKEEGIDITEIISKYKVE